MTRPMSEKQLQQAVVDCARLLGWRVYHTFDSRRSEPGFPDLTLVKGRRLLFVELKTQRGRVTEAQQEWLDALGDTRAESYVWKPSHWLEGIVEYVLKTPQPANADMFEEAA